MVDDDTLSLCVRGGESCRTHVQCVWSVCTLDMNIVANVYKTQLSRPAYLNLSCSPGSVLNAQTIPASPPFTVCSPLVEETERRHIP